MNDFESIFGTAEIKLYADDAKLYVKYDKTEILNEGKSEIENSIVWTDRMQLKIAFQKCQVIQFGTNNSFQRYSFGGVELPQVSEVSDLGVIISDNLKFSAHCAKIARDGYRMVNLIYAVFTNRSIDFLCKMYKAYVLPKVEYACEIWCPYFVRDIDAIEGVQRLFVRRLPGMAGLDYKARLAKLNWITLACRRIHRDLILTYKIVNKLIDLNFHEFFEFCNSASTRGHRLKLQVKRNRLDLRRHFFCNRVVKHWNRLSEETVCSRTLELFKKRVRSYDPQGGGQM
jgi:hypothetical protein